MERGKIKTQRATQGKMHNELTSRGQKQGQPALLRRNLLYSQDRESHNSCPARFDDLWYFSFFAFQVGVFILIVFFLLVLVKL